MRAILIMLLVSLAASFATAGTPDRSDWKKAWYRARQGDAYQYPTNGLVAYWSMDSVSGTTVYDTWGSNDGTAVETPLFDSAYGKHLDGVNFNGSSQYMQVADSDSMDVGAGGEASFSFWIKPASAVNGDGIIEKYNVEGSQRSYYIDLDTTSGRVRFQASQDGLAFASAFPTAVLNFNQHNHVCITFNAGTVVFFINGVSESRSISQTSIFKSTANTNIGFRKDSFGGYFEGQLDEVAIWNRALFSNEVSKIYNNGAGRFYTP